MTLRLTIAWRNDNSRTIWNQLAVRLGRQPTKREAADEALRILSEVRDAT